MKPLRRRAHSWKDNIRMDLEEIGWEVVDRNHPSQDRASSGFL
jgi:hypothetical protein